MKKWKYLSNVTDEMLLAWHKTSALKKFEWLEAMRKLRGLALPKEKRKLLWLLK